MSARCTPASHGSAATASDAGPPEVTAPTTKIRPTSMSCRISTTDAWSSRFRSSTSTTSLSRVPASARETDMNPATGLAGCTSGGSR